MDLTLLSSHVQHSYQKWQKEVRIQEIVDELDSDDGDAYGGADGNMDETPDDREIQIKLKLIKEKGKWLAKSEIELKGLYGRWKSTERASSVQTDGKHFFVELR